MGQLYWCNCVNIITADAILIILSHRDVYNSKTGGKVRTFFEFTLPFALQCIFYQLWRLPFALQINIFAISYVILSFMTNYISVLTVIVSTILSSNSNQAKSVERNGVRHELFEWYKNSLYTQSNVKTDCVNWSKTQRKKCWFSNFHACKMICKTLKSKSLQNWVKFNVMRSSNCH